MPAATPKTYVLIGNDQEDAYKAYKERSDCIIIRYDDPRYPTLEKAIEAIKPPANVILQCHGGNDGTFQWHKDEWRGYAEFFGHLPQGVASVMLGSCYGGTAEAEAMLTAAPAGLLVQSMTGPTTLNSGNVSFKFAEESAGLTKPVDLFLEALDNFNPAEYKKYMEYWNKKTETNYDTNPNHALPHILGLGGNPPQRIDLADEMQSLKFRQNDPAFRRAVKRVQDRFDTNYFRFTPNDPGHIEDGSLGAAAEDALDQRIAAMANRLAKGYTPAKNDAEGNRLAYAITAAYPDESGQLQHLIENQQSVRRDAGGRPISKASPWEQATQSHKTYAPSLRGGASEKELCETGDGKRPCLTHDELAYLKSVAIKLQNDPKKDQTIARLTEVFSHTAGNDAINEGSALNNELRSKHINTKNWTR